MFPRRPVGSDGGPSCCLKGIVCNLAHILSYMITFILHWFGSAPTLGFKYSFVSVLYIILWFHETVELLTCGTCGVCLWSQRAKTIRTDPRVQISRAERLASCSPTNLTQRTEWTGAYAHAPLLSISQWDLARGSPTALFSEITPAGLSDCQEIPSITKKKKCQLTHTALGFRNILHEIWGFFHALHKARQQKKRKRKKRCKMSLQPTWGCIVKSTKTALVFALCFLHPPISEDSFNIWKQAHFKFSICIYGCSFSPGFDARKKKTGINIYQNYFSTQH